MTHYEYTQQHRPSTPCRSYHMTFGGRCLNCGYNPESMSALQRACVLATVRAQRALRCKRSWRLTQARVAAVAALCLALSGCTYGDPLGAQGDLGADGARVTPAPTVSTCREYLYAARVDGCLWRVKT